MPYARMYALIYAGIFWDKVCHDARVATKQGYPTKINNVTLTSGLPFTQVGAISGEEDCSHFISCCVGQGRGKLRVGGRDIDVYGGGLQIPSPFANAKVYGETYAPRLVGALIANKSKVISRQFLPTHDFNTRDAIVRNLGPGDILAYASKDSAARYEHVCIIVGQPTSNRVPIAWHTRHRLGQDYTDVYFPWVTLLKLP